MQPIGDFSAALLALKHGEKITRQGWNAGGQWVELVDRAIATRVPSRRVSMSMAHSEEELATIVLRRFPILKNAQGGWVPWLPSVGDLLAEDWVTLRP